MYKVKLDENSIESAYEALNRFITANDSLKYKFKIKLLQYKTTIEKCRFKTENEANVIKLKYDLMLAQTPSPMNLLKLTIERKEA